MSSNLREYEALYRQQGRAAKYHSMCRAADAELASKISRAKLQLARRVGSHHKRLLQLQLEKELQSRLCVLCQLQQAQAWGLGHADWQYRLCSQCFDAQAQVQALQGLSASRQHGKRLRRPVSDSGVQPYTQQPADQHLPTQPAPTCIPAATDELLASTFSLQHQPVFLPKHSSDLVADVFVALRQNNTGFVLGVLNSNRDMWQSLQHLASQHAARKWQQQPDVPLSQPRPRMPGDRLPVAAGGSALQTEASLLYSSEAQTRHYGTAKELHPQHQDDTYAAAPSEDRQWREPAQSFTGVIHAQSSNEHRKLDNLAGPSHVTYAHAPANEVVKCCTDNNIKHGAPAEHFTVAQNSIPPREQAVARTKWQPSATEVCKVEHGVSHDRTRQQLKQALVQAEEVVAFGRTREARQEAIVYATQLRQALVDIKRLERIQLKLKAKRFQAGVVRASKQGLPSLDACSKQAYHNRFAHHRQQMSTSFDTGGYAGLRYEEELAKVRALPVEDLKAQLKQQKEQRTKVMAQQLARLKL